MVEVNVYAVGLFADAAKVKKLAGSSLKGKTADQLSKETGYYKLLLDPDLNKVRVLLLLLLLSIVVKEFGVMIASSLSGEV